MIHFDLKRKRTHALVSLSQTFSKQTSSNSGYASKYLSKSQARLKYTSVGRTKQQCEEEEKPLFEVRQFKVMNIQ